MGFSSFVFLVVLFEKDLENSDEFITQTNDDVI